MEQFKKTLEQYDLSSHIDDAVDSIPFDPGEKLIKEILVLNKDLIQKSIEINLLNSVDSRDYDQKIDYLMAKNDKISWKKAIKHIMVQEIVNGAAMGIEIALKQINSSNKNNR